MPAGGLSLGAPSHLHTAGSGGAPAAVAVAHTAGGLEWSGECGQCRQAWSVQLVPKVVHERSNLLAVVRAEGCAPVDLLPSMLAGQCGRWDRGLVMCAGGPPAAAALHKLSSRSTWRPGGYAICSWAHSAQVRRCSRLPLCASWGAERAQLRPLPLQDCFPGPVAQLRFQIANPAPQML